MTSKHERATNEKKAGTKSMGVGGLSIVSVVCRDRLAGIDTLPLFNYGVILRVFVPRICDGYDSGVVARMVRVALEEAKKRKLNISLITLPSGVGLIREAPFPIQSSRRPNTSDVEHHARSWATQLSTELDDHPPIILGLDGYTAPGVVGIQLAVGIEKGHDPTVTWKSLPMAGERSTLVTLWGPPNTTPPQNSLKKNHPVVGVGNMRALMLVCHDSTAFAGHATHNANDDTWTGVFHQQYDNLIEGGTVDFAVNLIHRLPKNAGGKMMTSPIFQSGHTSLRKHKIPVIAVAGLNDRCPSAAFKKLNRLLACDFRHLDLRIGLT